MSWTPRSGVYMDEYYNLVYPEGSSLLDGVDNRLLDVIDEHWRQFPPQHPVLSRKYFHIFISISKYFYSLSTTLLASPTSSSG